MADENYQCSEKMPLTMRQISHQKRNDGYAQVGIPTISIAADVLAFLGYAGRHHDILVELVRAHGAHLVAAFSRDEGVLYDVAAVFLGCVTWR